MINNNKMIYKGILVGSRSYNGISLDLLRSGLKKYIINGNNKKAIWFCIEFDLFDKLNINPIKTNLMNKLFLIMVEHINIANINLLIILDTLLDKWSINNDKISLITSIKLLSESPKNNIVFIWNKVLNNLVKKKKINTKPFIDNSFIREFTKSIENNISNYTIGDYWVNSGPKDTIELRKYMDNFIYFLDKSNYNCLYWLSKIDEMTFLKIKSEKRYRRYKPIYAIWEYLFSRCDNVYDNVCDNDNINKILNILFKLYTKKNENLPYLINACLIFIEKINILKKIDYKLLENDYVKHLYDKNLNYEFINFDYFILDKYIKEGRTLDNIKYEGNLDIPFIYNTKNIDSKIIMIYNILDTNIKVVVRKKKKIKIETNELIEDCKPGENNQGIIMNIKNDKTQQITDFMEGK